MAMMPVGSVVPFVKSGKVKALAVTSSVRSPSLPEVPAMGETRTLRDVNMTVWFGLFGPAGIDKPIAAKLASEVRSVLGQANVKQRIGEMGMEPTPADGAAFAGFLTAENAKFKAIVDERHIKAE